MEQNSQLVFPTYRNFRNAQRQHVHGYEYVEVEPSTKTDQLYEFELSSANPLAFGVATGFRVEGVFQCKGKEATDAWVNVPADDSKIVTLQQNWWDHYVKQVDVFYGNNPVNQDDMPPFINAYINAFMYAHMHKGIKKLLCMEECHPGRSVSVNHGNYKARGSTSTTTDDWTAYSKTVFNKDSVSFLYTPLHVFPFYQDVNYVYGENGGFNVLPLQTMGKLQVRVFFREDSSILFNKVDTNEKTYRFVLNKMTLLLKEVRLAPSVARSMASAKGTYLYRGLTKVAVTENVRGSDFTHRSTFPGIDMPEGIFIFCLDKTVLSGRAKFQDLSLDGTFKAHNIASCDVHFNGQHFYAKGPNFGHPGHFQIQRENFAKLVSRGPFGMLMDPDALTFERQGVHHDWSFPCVWLDLTESSPHTRLQTVHSDVNYMTNKMGDLTVVMNFESPNGAVDALYVVVAYYTDTNLQLDMRTKKFYPVYNKNKIIN